MARHDLSKASNFVLTFKDQRQLEWMVQEATLPGFNLGEMPLMHPTQNLRMPGDATTWNDLICQIILDEDGTALWEAYEYIINAKNPETGEMKLDEILFDAKLHIMSNKNNPVRTVTFYNTWIRAVTDIQFLQTTSEDETPTFSVEMTFSHFKITNPDG
jgi:hypothetical protein